MRLLFYPTHLRAGLDAQTAKFDVASIKPRSAWRNTQAAPMPQAFLWTSIWRAGDIATATENCSNCHRSRLCPVRVESKVIRPWFFLPISPWMSSEKYDHNHSEVLRAGQSLGTLPHGLGPLLEEDRFKTEMASRKRREMAGLLFCLSRKAD